MRGALKYLSLVVLCTQVVAGDIDDDLAGFDDEVSPKVEKSSSSNSKSTSKKSTDDLLSGFDDEESSSDVVASESSKDSNTTTASNDTQKDDLLDGFDDDSEQKESAIKKPFLEGLSGSFSETFAYSFNGKGKDKGLSMAKSSLFLDYEHKFYNGWKFKTNAKAYFDALYKLRDDEPYTKEEKDAFEDEIRLYDAYLEGSITEHLDFRVGKQVVVWGRSDTIRVTDILNPLDNRRPALVDIEDLRLPIAMAKFDYYVDKWRITPIMIFEQKFSLNPPFGTPFYPVAFKSPSNEDYHDVTGALSVGGEFSGWDLNLYLANIYQDSGYLKMPMTPFSKIEHSKIKMAGFAFNLLKGSWLLKGESAYLKDLRFTSLPNQKIDRVDSLLGLEYNGFADTMISYDISLRHIFDYDKALKNEMIPTDENTYQQAFRVSSDFLNATIKGNYLISLFGSSASDGGFQRAWADYDFNDDIQISGGVVDYIGGSKYFDKIKNSDMIYLEAKYSF